MTRLVLILPLLLCNVGCPERQTPAPASMISIEISGDAGVKFDASYTWSNGKTDTLSGAVRNGTDGVVGARRFHNEVPNDRRITALTIESLSGTGELSIVIKKKGKDGETIVFEGLASGENAMIAYNAP